MAHLITRNPGAPRHRASHVHQHGAYAIEFALTFFLFFLLLYAVLTYGLIFVAQQTLNRAAETGARSMLSWQTDLAHRADSARERIEHTSEWLESFGGTDTVQIAICSEAGLLTSTTAAPPCASPNSDQIRVVVLYPYAQAPLVPLLGPGTASRWLVPKNLSAEASINLGVAYQGTVSVEEEP